MFRRILWARVARGPSVRATQAAQALRTRWAAPATPGCHARMDCRRVARAVSTSDRTTKTAERAATAVQAVRRAFKGPVRRPASRVRAFALEGA